MAFTSLLFGQEAGLGARGIWSSGLPPNALFPPFFFLVVGARGNVDAFNRNDVGPFSPFSSFPTQTKWLRWSTAFPLFLFSLFLSGIHSTPCTTMTSREEPSSSLSFLSPPAAGPTRRGTGKAAFAPVGFLVGKKKAVTSLPFFFFPGSWQPEHACYQFPPPPLPKGGSPEIPAATPATFPFFLSPHRPALRRRRKREGRRVKSSPPSTTPTPSKTKKVRGKRDRRSEPPPPPFPFPQRHTGQDPPKYRKREFGGIGSPPLPPFFLHPSQAPALPGVGKDVGVEELIKS